MIAFLISAFVSSCGEQGQTMHTQQPVQDKADHAGIEQQGAHNSELISTQTPRPQESGAIARPALNLSIRDLTDSGTDGESTTDANRYFPGSTEQQADMLTAKKADDGIKLSGKIFTDQTMIDNKQYLDSVDGIQVNIEGNFR